jgi:hypothetical protein
MKIADIQDEINSGDLTFEEIATVFDITIRQVDIVWLDMINAKRKKDEPLFTLE